MEKGVWVVKIVQKGLQWSLLMVLVVNGSDVDVSMAWKKVE